MFKKILLIGVVTVGLGSTSSLPAQHEVDDSKPEKVTESVVVLKKEVIDEYLIKRGKVVSYNGSLREFNAAKERAINEEQERVRKQYLKAQQERVEQLRAIQRERLAAVERQRIEEERLRVKRANDKAKSQQPSTVKGTLNIEFSYYIAMCDSGCTGKTATGINVRNKTTHEGMRIVATDPRVIPTWSIIQFEMDGQMVKAIALDTGGAIKGHKVDMLVGTTSEAKKRGRHVLKVEVLRYGK